MDAYLLASPLNFGNLLAQANALVASDLSGARAAVLRVASAQTPLSNGGTVESVAQFVLAGARKNGADGRAVAVALTRHTDASPKLAELLGEAVNAAAAGAASQDGAPAGSASASTVAAAAQHDKLLGVDWALGVPVASSTMAGAGAAPPFVTIQLRVCRPDGTVGTEAVTANAAQLAVLEASLREAALALERV